jgi:taurine dioxygenase
MKESEKAYPSAEHPVVRTHPRSGRQALFGNRIFTKRVVQLSAKESAALLDMLFQHIETPLFQCRFQWRPGSMAFWDNRCAQHHAVWDYYPHRRRGLRVTIQGDRPYYRAGNRAAARGAPPSPSSCWRWPRAPCWRATSGCSSSPTSSFTPSRCWG